MFFVPVCPGSAVGLPEKKRFTHWDFFQMYFFFGAVAGVQCPLRRKTTNKLVGEVTLQIGRFAFELLKKPPKFYSD